MRLRRLEVERFRGIRTLDWRGVPQAAALVGPGDSRKSTVLEAIERTLSPRWNVPFSDSDFWSLDVSRPIQIRCTLTGFPSGFYRDTKFGLCLQRFDASTGTTTPPGGESGEEHALVIQLDVDASLEPIWSVVDADGELHPIHAKDREALGMLRVGDFVDRHLSWSRGSALARMTESGDSITAILADALRQARQGLTVEGLERLSAAANLVEELAREIGVAPTVGLAPHLDASSLSIAGGSLSLHDGAVPTRQSGLGTRRLLTLAMHRRGFESEALTIIDEFEHGLEPHRIRRLLRVLRGKPPESADVGGQLVLTTHSPTVLSELTADEVCVIRNDANGDVAIASLPAAAGYILPRTPEALLARKVIVGEGATEVGLVSGLDAYWGQQEGRSFAYYGVVIVDGEGSSQPAELAGHLSSLGYEVALLVDSDAQAKVTRAKGAHVLAWPGNASTEERLAQDLPLDGLHEMLSLAVHSRKSKGSRSVRDAIAAELRTKPSEIGDDIDAWLSSGDLNELRVAFGKCAKKKGWFKDEGLGKQLGAIAFQNWDGLGQESKSTLEQLREFAHGG